MLQGPFRVPSFNGYIPRRLQPWIYLLFAFIFLMSGGIYGGAMSQVMGEYSLMREDVLMIIMFNVVGVAMPFPFLFKMKFHFTNRQLLLNAALVVATCNFLIMWTDSVPVMCILAYIAGFFKLCGTFECMSTIQLWMTSKRDFTIFFPLLYCIVLGNMFLSPWITEHLIYIYQDWRIINWAMTGIVDITAVALYMHYWGAFGGVPQWVFALAALTIVGTMNMIGVKWFAEMEFWFALIKVLAIVTFLVVGTVFLGSGQPLDGNTTGFHLITDNGGFFPHGLLPALVLIQGVVFAFASIEMVGTAAGECKDPQTMVPKAINSVIWRIGLFYVGSVVLLVMLLPWSAYQAGQSPFVTFFSKLGVPYIGSIMNIVVLTAALSSLNSGLYCTGRILRSMAMGGSAPSFMAKMSRQHVPYAGILATLVVYVVGVFLNYLVPSRVFEIVLNFASLGIIASWAFIIVCQMRLRKAIKEGKAADVSFKLPGAPFTSWLTLLFLLSVLVLMAFDYPNGTYTIAALPIIGILLVIGWFGVRKRVAEIHSTAPVVEEDEEKQEIVFKPETAS